MMTSDLTFKNLIGTDANQFDEFFKIYVESIEKSEQKPEEKILAMCQSRDYHIRLLYSGLKNSGFTLSYVNPEEKFALLEYMAVDRHERSHGHGSALLRDLVGSLSKKNLDWLFLEVDSPYQKSPDLDARIRRVNFYKKNGCREIESLDYILPLPSAPSGLKMKLMTYDVRDRRVGSIDTRVLKQAVQDIYIRVYNCDPTDHRLEKMFSNLPETLNLKN